MRIPALDLSSSLITFLWQNPISMKLKNSSQIIGCAAILLGFGLLQAEILQVRDT